MMLNKIEEGNIIKLIEKKTNKNIELEARICGEKFTKDVKIDYYKFENILNHLVFSKQNGGMGLSYKMTTTLDIRTTSINDSVRLTIDGKDMVKMYWLKENVKDLDEKSYYVKSGYGQETVDAINKESKLKFPAKSFSDLDFMFVQ